MVLVGQTPFVLLVVLIRKWAVATMRTSFRLGALMELDAGELRRGTRWFVFAGLAAVCLSVFLAVADLALNYSSYEKRRAAELSEVRRAGTLLQTGALDQRTRVPAPLSQ